jgi:hypothetical protein
LQPMRHPPSTHSIAGRIFLRSLAAIYLVAFVSLWVQVEGLAGSRGILPASETLRFLEERLPGAERFLRFPTLCWLGRSDGFLHSLCAAGTGLSLVALLLPLSALLWLLLWALYLSLAVVCREFLGFQWDILLLETGFLAIFLAPARMVPGASKAFQPSRIAVWLLWWLLFRLLFASGVVKLTWGDPTWWDLSALEHHYETQCIPPWTAWYVHKLPSVLHRASTGAMFFVEIAVSCFFFAPPRLRRIAALIQILLQLGIIATGNYCFFNWLTIALSLLLIDDRGWPAWVRARMLPEPPAEEGAGAVTRPRPPRRWPRWALVPAAAILAAASLLTFAGGLVRGGIDWPRAVAWPLATLAPLRLVNSYGLFRVMTTERPEIVIEGSRDGKEWKAYEFRYKPGDLARRPPFVAPHQPRLDWQMWFAALGEARQNPWFLALCARLLEGSPPVLGLLEENPFPGGPPRYLRATLYRYYFTSFEERRITGNWWKREQVRAYLPVVSR